MFVIKYKNIFFLISGILVLASAIAITVWGLQPGVDFVGGSILEVRYGEALDGSTTGEALGDSPTGKARPTSDELAASLSAAGFEVSNVRVTEQGYIVRMGVLEEGERDAILAVLTQEGAYAPTIERLSSVGPSVGEELRRKTFLAIALVVLMIILYIAFTFRKVAAQSSSHHHLGVSSWVYGLVAILTLLHDIIIPAGVFAALGHFQGLEADTLFVVALLTILGVSVNDTIVVFDRIRENLRRNHDLHREQPFAEVVGEGLKQTYVRSFNTSFTIVLVLLILFFLGGPTIHSFILTLLVGQIAGTYSSIFLAAPLLVVIGERKVKA